jgi:hypothetical protein
MLNRAPSRKLHRYCMIEVLACTYQFRLNGHSCRPRGWKEVLRGLSDKAGLQTLKDVAVNTGVALALKAIYDSGDVGSGLAQMTKFVTSAEATELSIAVAETFTMPALVLAATELQGNSVSAQEGGLLGSGGISGVAGFIRGQMQAGIDERANETVNSTAPSFDGSKAEFKTPQRII